MKRGGYLPIPKGELSSRYLKGVWIFFAGAKVWYIPRGVTIPAIAMSKAMKETRLVRKTTLLRTP